MTPCPRNFAVIVEVKEMSLSVVVNEATSQRKVRIAHSEKFTQDRTAHLDSLPVSPTPDPTLSHVSGCVSGCSKGGRKLFAMHLATSAQSSILSMLS